MPKTRIVVVPKYRGEAAGHDEIAGEVAKQNVALDLRVLCGISHAEAHVPVRGSVKRATCGLNGRLPDAHVTAAVFLGATVDMPISCLYLSIRLRRAVLD